MKVGFDLDRIFINYPPFIPPQIIDWLYKSHSNGLSYRIPTAPLEQFIRRLSHLYLLRPQIRQNIDFVHHLQSSHHKLYLVSSRFGFLEGLTKAILKKYNLIHPFTSINLNLENEQPHLFKEKAINELGLDLFIDDDLELLEYLGKRCPGVKLFWYTHSTAHSLPNGITRISKLEQILKFLK